MHAKKILYWSQGKQRIKFTAQNSFEGIEQYAMIGWCTDMELEVMIDILFTRFGDDFISTPEIMTIFHVFREHIDRLKRITDENDIAPL